MSTAHVPPTTGTAHTAEDTRAQGTCTLGVGKRIATAALGLGLLVGGILGDATPAAAFENPITGPATHGTPPRRSRCPIWS